MAERDLIHVGTSVGGKKREFTVSYPQNLHPLRVSTSFVGFSRDTSVQESLMGLDDDCVVTLIVDKNDDILGLSIPTDCSNN